MQAKSHDTAGARSHPGKAAAMAACHLAALFSPLFFTWEGLAVFLLLVVLVGQLGVGLGYHRLLCHRSYRAAWSLRPLFGLLGVLAGTASSGGRTSSGRWSARCQAWPRPRTFAG
jgi:fatty-acid desaturase